MSIPIQTAVNDAEALEMIQRLARFGRIAMTSHARRRMTERGARLQDVRRALLTATAAIPQDGRDTWRVNGGVDTDGDALALICDLEAEVVVVTLF